MHVFPFIFSFLSAKFIACVVTYEMSLLKMFSSELGKLKYS